MAFSVLLWIVSLVVAVTADFPDPSKLPNNPNFPDPLTIYFTGEKITTPSGWTEKRYPELKELFTYYEYGSVPPPLLMKATVHSTNKNFFGGKATLKNVMIRIGPNYEMVLPVILLIPNARKKPAPTYVGLNFCGNFELLTDPSIPLPPASTWYPNYCPGVVNNQATEAGRGKRVDVWALEQSIDNGYAVATLYHGDVQPDTGNATNGIIQLYAKQGNYTWGNIAAWGWGISRIVDYLLTDPDVDATKIAVVGHSRNAKAAIVAGVYDKRISLIVPSEAGCSGTAPARSTEGEQLKDINTVFPYWFPNIYHEFNNQVGRLPFDQHSFIALCAPRPVLLLNAVEDTWGNPPGQFEMLVQANSVYKLLGTDGLVVDKMPTINFLVNSTLGYVIRPGVHSMTADDWKYYMQFSDIHWKLK